MRHLDHQHEGRQIVAGRGAEIWDKQGRRYIDLNMGYGAVWLGHKDPVVTRALAAALEQYTGPGYLPTAAAVRAERALEGFIAPDFRLGGIYSTGTEAIEVALRAARAQTGRVAVVGFNGSMHGKSFVTAALGSTVDIVPVDFVHCLPGFGGADVTRPAEPESGESNVEAALTSLSSHVDLAAIVIEPLQMSGGGHEASGDVYHAVFRIARDCGALVIVDETLTGFYRCGVRHYLDLLPETPDIAVFGKGFANGFPASAVTYSRTVEWVRDGFKPGSTYMNHPLACTAVAATLEQLITLDPLARVRGVEAVVKRELEGLELRGRGAMWCLGVESRECLASFAGTLLDAGIVVSYYDRYIRLLPSLTIDLDLLASACSTIRDVYATAFR